MGEGGAAGKDGGDPLEASVDGRVPCAVLEGCLIQLRRGETGHDTCHREARRGYIESALLT